MQYAFALKPGLSNLQSSPCLLVLPSRRIGVNGLIHWRRRLWKKTRYRCAVAMSKSDMAAIIHRKSADLLFLLSTQEKGRIQCAGHSVQCFYSRLGSEIFALTLRKARPSDISYLFYYFSMDTRNKYKRADNLSTYAYIYIYYRQ